MTVTNGGWLVWETYGHQDLKPYQIATLCVIGSFIGINLLLCWHFQESLNGLEEKLNTVISKSF